METIIGAFLGAIFSLLLPEIIAWTKIRRFSSLAGEWQSVYLNRDNTANQWTIEKISIEPKFNKLHLKSVENEAGLSWSATGKIIDKKYIIGTGSSNKSGAHSSGPFLLVISPQGDCLYGTFSGPNSENMIITGDWILGKTKEDIKLGKRLLKRT